VVFVGDMDSDEQAARDAKVPLAWAAHFFGVTAAARKGQ
jgi:phosphoglycolate phosphatase-like HAD superfamily hydrolase